MSQGCQTADWYWSPEGMQRPTLIAGLGRHGVPPTM
jgi:hypothetical protein